MSAPSPPFDRAYPVEEGIVRALERPVPSSPAQLVNRLPLAARLYEPLWRRRSLAILTLGGYRTERELETMLARLEPAPGQRILDAACSAGLYARTLARAAPGAEVHALDHSLPFLRRAGRDAERDGVELVRVRADVAALPYRAAAFDAVACGGSLNEFADPVAALREFGRVLRPGGRLWLMYVLRAAAPPGRLIQLLLRPGGVRFPTAAEVEAWAGAGGLRLERAEYRRPLALALFRRGADPS